MLMKRISLVVAVAAFGTLLSGCEALQTQKNATAQPAAPAAAAAPTAQNPPAPPTVPATPPSAAAAPNGAPQPAAGAAQQQGAPVLFLLAQPEKAQGLNELKLKDGSLWYLPQPALSRDDLTRVTPLQEKDGKGVVRFDFNPAGAKKLADLSQKFQGKYLVLVVGRDVVAAPRIAGAMNQGAMFIVVPSAAQAQAITQDIAGARQ
jgi:preprotein translocase subunit SecD